MSISKVFVSELTDSDPVETIFLVASKAIRETRNGDPYLCVTLQDRTGTIEGRAWDDALALEERFGVDDFVALRGRVSSYRGELQLNIADLDKISDDRVNLEDFLPHSRWKSHHLFEKLEELLEAEIASDEVRRFFDALFEDETLRQNYLRAPAAVSNHHAYLAGLAEHSLSMARLAVRVGRHYEAYYPGLADTDLLVAGCILHDIGKIEELTYRRSFAYSTEGRLVGHIAGGCELIGRVAAHMSPPLDEDLERQLKHLVLSHHGKREYGAPITPRTPEAILLHELDMIDSRMNMCWNACEALLEGESEHDGWSDYQRVFSGSIYVGATTEGTWRGPRRPPSLDDGPGLNPAAAGETAPKAIDDATSQTPRDKIDPGGDEDSLNLSLFDD